MADNLTLNSGSGGATLAADEIASVHHQRVKVQHGADGSATDVSAASPLPVDQQSALPAGDNNIGNVDIVTLPKDGQATMANSIPVVIASDQSAVSVDDGGGSLTVDGTVAVTHSTLAVTGGGVESGALRVTIANDSTGVVSVDDGGGSLTVDGTVGVSGSVTVDSELTTADLDTGAGTDTRAVVGVALAESGGAVLVGSGNPMPVDDAGGSLTVDNAALSVTGGGAEASALRVTLANDSTGVISVDDGGGALTVDGTVTADQGAAQTAANGWPIRASDGTNLINVGDNANSAVRVNVVAGSTAGTEFNEDTAHTTGDAGTMILGVRNDAGGSLSGTDGDYTPIQFDSSGRLRVVTQGGAGGTSSVDDAAFTVATDSGTPSMGLFDDVTPDSVDEGDVGVLRMSANRVLYNTIRDAAGNERGANVTASNELQVIASAQPGVDIGDVTINNASIAVTNAALSVTGGGAEASALRVTLANDSTGVLSVDDNGGSLTVDGTVAVSAVTPGTGATDLGKAVDSASGSTDTGVAALAIRDDSLSALTPVEGDYVPLRVSSTGALHVTGGGGGTEYTVDAAAPAAPTGTASLMERDDALTSLTEIEGDWTNMRSTAEGALWTQDFNSDAMAADLSTLAGAVSGTEMQVDVVTSALPTGAATAANQLPDGHNVTDQHTAKDLDYDSGAGTDTVSAFGIALPASGGAVAGGTSSNPVRVDPTGTTTQPVSGTVTADAGTGPWPVTDNGGSLTVDAPVGTPVNVQIGDGTDQAAVTAAGALQVDGSGVTQPVSGTITADAGTGTFTVSQTNIATDDYDTGAGTSTQSMVGIALPASGGPVAGGTATNPVRTDPTGTTTQPVSGTVTANLSATDNAVLDSIDTNTTTLAGAVAGSEMQVDIVAALPAGTNAIGKLAANSGVDIGDVDVTSIAAGSNLIGDVGLSGARTSGGTTLYKNLDVDETEDQVKGSAGQLYWIHAMNLSAAPVYLKIYNATAASVTVGTTTPDMTFPIPTQGDTNGAGFVLAIPNGIAFDTAITIACTTGVADNNTGAPGGNACVVNLGYA